MKFKKIPNEYSNYICDKFSRFKPASIRLKILFNDIVNKFYLDGDLSSLNELERAQIAVKIINASFEENELDNLFFEMFKKLEHEYFSSNDLSLKYLSFKINLTSIINSVSSDILLPKNVLWLKKLVETKDFNIFDLRNQNDLLYPLVGVILCEGQTEYTLLNTIFNLFDINLDKLGFMVYPAGGKNQVARKYYELIEFLKLPIYILLDNDADETKKLIDAKLRLHDKLYLIKSGEFEDLIPVKILLNTINSVHNNDFNCNFDDFSGEIPMSHKLDLIYKKYGYGEFKKAQFAKELNEYIKLNSTKDDFLNSEIKLIVETLFSL